MAVKVRLSGVQKTYGGKRVLDDVSLDIPAGTVMGLLGPNGAGKSTLLRILLGLTPPTNGVVEYNGVALWPNPTPAMAMVSGFVDAPRFYRSLTGRQNLMLLADVLHKPHSRIDQVLQFVHMQDLADVSQGSYSHGMRQRLGIAAALVKEPGLLVLDEPSDGLDPARLRDMRQLLARIHMEFGTTIILSSHALDDIEKLCDAIAVVDQGKLRYFGPVNQLGDTMPGEVVWEVWPPERAMRHLLTYGIVARRDGTDRIAARWDVAWDLGEINQSLMKAGLMIRTVVQRGGSLESRLLAYLEEFNVDAR